MQIKKIKIGAIVILTLLAFSLYAQADKPLNSQKTSTPDSLKNECEKQAVNLQIFKSEEEEWLESEINSRISKNATKTIVSLWTDKSKINVNDNFRIIIESNVEFDTESITIDDINHLSDKIKVLSKTTQSTYENGSENHSLIFMCKALVKGKLKIKPIKVKTEHKTIKTKRRRVKIID